MLFTHIDFFIFLAVVLAAHRMAGRSHRAQKLLLLGASYYFYAYWDWRFLSLVIISTVVDFLVGRGLGQPGSQLRRKGLLLCSILVNLGILGFFKYFNFFIASAATLLRPVGLHPATLNIILPIGISFYTFQTLSYSIDVYRGRLAPCRDIGDFALFVGFFPQLVAGPIVRATHFLPQLATPPTVSAHDGFVGFRQFVLGLFKKVFIADRLAIFVDMSFGEAGEFSAATTWLSVLCYAIQIYCDFSGYSDMAIGTARMFGYRLSKNFDHPYIATSIAEFWRRWHISLSSWLRDYLYIPLGGNRRGIGRTYLNVMITMLLGGLWHGAEWTFVAWGGLHGLALVSHKAAAAWFDGSNLSGRWRRGRKALGWMLTMLIVLVGWVLFRAETFGQAGLIFRQMFVPLEGISWHPAFPLGVVLLVALGHGIHASGRGDLMELRPERLLTPVVLTTLLVLTGLAAFFYPEDFIPFIYFQF